jgi:hypothetical protein
VLSRTTLAPAVAAWRWSAKLHHHLLVAQGLFDRTGKNLLHVRTFGWGRWGLAPPSGPTATEAAAESIKQVVDVGTATATETATPAAETASGLAPLPGGIRVEALLQRFLTKGVVAAPPLLVAKHLIGGIDLFKLGLCTGIFV